MNAASPRVPDARHSGVYLQTTQERVVFGLPAGEAVVAEAERLGAERVFVVSGASLARLAERGEGPLARVERALGARLAGRFGAMRAHSPREDVVAAANAARAARADLLVAVGGGSAIDGTKAMLMCLWHGLSEPAAMEPFRWHPEGGSAQPIEARPSPRMISVSTTLSAADFTPGAGVTDAGTKQQFRHPRFAPTVAVLDPAATLDTPVPLLLATGLRAVDHAVESYCSLHAHAPGEIHSLVGLSLLGKALPAIHRAPQDPAPRRQAQLGMWQAILGSITGAGTGASHGIGYALGATFDIAHGHTSCVMLPAVLAYNEPVNGDRQAVLAAEMGQPGEPLAKVIAALVRGLGLPSSLRELGIGEEHLGEIARRSLAYEPVQRNPRPLANVEDVLAVLRLAYDGVQ